MYEHLLAPARIGRLQLRNHCFMGPTDTHLTSSDGSETFEDIAYFVRRARGGAALITTGQTQACTRLDPIDPYPRSGRLDDDCYIPMYSELTEAVHLEGAKISVLLSPGGGAQALGVPYETGYEGIKEVLNVAPGTIECPVAQRKVRKLTVEEIHQFVDVYGRSAQRAKRAGFDAVTIHAHCGYLIAEFLSPFFNNRDDEYGGSLENRARFLLELVASVQKYCGKDFPVFVRIAGDEYIGENGRQLPETIEIAKMLEKAGVAALDVGAGVFQTMSLICPTIYHEKGCLVTLAEAIKANVSIPVITQGRLQDPELAEQILAEGKSDFISLSRAWIADPDWLNKVKAGQSDCVRRCISCNNCIGRINKGLPVRCTMNAFAGREHKFPNEVEQAAAQKKVAVIGAGPAGCETAYRLGQKGYQVDLYEAAEDLCSGPQYHAATVPPAKEILWNVRDFYKVTLSRMDNVNIHLNTKVDDALVEQLDVDAAVIACGAVPVIPPIPGLRENRKVVTAVDVLNGKASVHGKVVIAGGGQVALECAHWLKEQGYQEDVSVVEMMPALAMDGELMTNLVFLPKLAEAGVHEYVSHRILKVNESSLSAQDLLKNEERELPFDTLVMALGMRPEKSLYDTVAKKVPTVYLAGGSDQPANITKAVESGFFTAMKL